MLGVIQKEKRLADEVGFEEFLIGNVQVKRLRSRIKIIIFWKFIVRLQIYEYVSLELQIAESNGKYEFHLFDKIFVFSVLGELNYISFLLVSVLDKLQIKWSKRDVSWKPANEIPSPKLKIPKR